MGLSPAERRIIEKARRSVRWSRVNAWVLGLSAAAMLTAAALLTKVMADHLREHHVALSELFALISESQHPSGVQLSLVFLSVAGITMLVFTAMSHAGNVLVIKIITAERRLLLKLAAPHDEPRATESNYHD
ncbi:MAG: hypothetical protein WD066_16490 [Planctomycetaceae bacterium]